MPAGITSDMTAVQLEEAREALGLTEAILGHFLGVEPRTIRRWKSGEWAIPIQVAMVLRLMLRHQLDPREVYRMATGLELTGIERSRRASERARARRQEEEP
jgi:DNA-binding transcriptional regulator YiaG